VNIEFFVELLLGNEDELDVKLENSMAELHLAEHPKRLPESMPLPS
jgi:hypothetical protein